MSLVPPEQFEALVAEALAELPPELAERISNVEVVVEESPGSEATGAQIAPGSILLGLYTGVPLTQRGAGYTWTLPDRITIYQGNIEQVAHSPGEIRATVRRVVIHEVGHHFGISDPRLQELGW